MFAKELIVKKSCIVCMLLITLCDITFANTRKKPQTAPPKHRSSEPFASFSLLDAKLTEVDREFGTFKAEVSEGSKMLPPKKRAALRTLHSSKSLRDLRKSVSNLGTITVRLRSRYSGQSYGRRISGALDRKAVTLSARMSSLSRAATWPATLARERQFDTALLSFVLQYQAISGGYAALACSPGDWTCCQPKNVPTKGSAPIAGCTWLCAKKRNCHGGCLGPRIQPSPAVRKTR